MQLLRHFYLALSLVTFSFFAVSAAALAAEETPSVPMLSGGVGEEDYDVIESAKSRFNVKILFTEANGAYVSDVNVVLMTAAGTQIATTTTEGPVLLVKLKPGSYAVKALVSGYVKEQKFKVSEKGMSSVHVAFPMHDAVD